MSEHGSLEFESFARSARPRLVRALAGARGEEAADGAAEALAYAWEHWDRVGSMGNPIGYLYRVGLSRTRPRQTPTLPPPEAIGLPEIEPALIPALLRLPEGQRIAVWLVHACQWQYGEVAEAMGSTTSMVGNHVARGLARLRQELEVHSSA